MTTQIRSMFAALGLSAVLSVPALAQTATTPALPAPAASPSVPKFAYVNSQTILAQSPGRAEAEAQFQKEMGTYRQQVQRMGDSLNAMMAAYDKAEITLSPPAKEARQKAIRTKEAEYQQRAQQMEQQMQQRQFELMQPIMAQVQKILTDIRAEDNYTFILDVGSTSGVVVAADKNLDITDRVLARLKALPPTARAGEPAKPAAGATPAPAGVTRPKP